MSEIVEKTKKAVFHFFGKKTFKEKQSQITGSMIDILKENLNSFPTKEELKKKIDDGLTKEEKDFMKDDKDLEKDYQIKSNTLLNLYNQYYLEKTIEALLKEKEKREVSYVPYESSESKRIREQNRIEEQNRQAASNELPQFLDKIKTDFSEKLKENISRMKEKIKQELNKYSSLNLKIFLQNLYEIEKIRDKLIENSKKESEIILNKSYNNSNHFNILLLGKTGAGKSTLINGIFDFNENEGAKTGEGRPITQEFGEYTSDKRKCLKIIDSKGIEMGEYNINEVFNLTKELIEKRAREGDPDKLIHCIWYCFQSGILRFEEIEKKTVTLLMSQYDENKLPIIIVITQSYYDNDTKTMMDFINEEFKFLNREIIIMPVVAKEKIVEIRKNKLVIGKDGIEELIKISFEKSQKAIYPAFLKSIKEKIIKAFEVQTEEKKNKLKDCLKEIGQQISNEIIENETIENNICKFSLIFEKTLNIFFEIPLISEEVKKIISEFLDDLCKWCIERLNDIISDLVKTYSDELSKLLLKEQDKVKNNHNVVKKLSNEKTLEEFRIESENYLKTYIISEVYFLAIKEICIIISEHIVKMGEEVMKEKFNQIIPELKNVISDEKLKQVTNKILQEIISNK